MEKFKQEIKNIGSNKLAYSIDLNNLQKFAFLGLKRLPSPLWLRSSTCVVVLTNHGDVTRRRLIPIGGVSNAYVIRAGPPVTDIPATRPQLSSLSCL